MGTLINTARNLLLTQLFNYHSVDNLKKFPASDNKVGAKVSNINCNCVNFYIISLEPLEFLSRIFIYIYI